MGIYNDSYVYNYRNSLVEDMIYSDGDYDVLGWKKGEIIEIN